MTLDEFIQREIDSGRIEDAECFYIGLVFTLWVAVCYTKSN